MYLPKALRELAWCLVASGCLIAAAAGRGDDAVSFSRDVMEVLSKGGCNQGACHGNQSGKGGFKLSLRGEDPAWDYAALARDVVQRRVNLFDPGASLLLQKPTGELAHEGGVRFKRDSDEYEILRRWIAAGAPGLLANEPALAGLEVTPSRAVLVEPAIAVRLRATAHFADGSSRDVTRLAVYELTDQGVTASHDGLVERVQAGATTVVVRYLDRQVPVSLVFLPARANFVAKAPPAEGFIDALVFSRLAELQINPSDIADDQVFVRRAFLDATGLLPTAEEAQAFVADAAPDKRERLIDRLLARAEFAEHWALKWSDILRNEEKVLDTKGVNLFYGWIKDSIAAGKPLDQFVRELVAAEGSTYANPPANFYRANRDPFTRGETAARLFLGVRLQCARCHNHPFDRWTQDDYYSWAAVFSRIEYKEIENKRSDKLDKHEFVGEQIVFVRPEGEVQNARTGQDALPLFLGAATRPFPPAADRLPRLAEWIASPGNELFVKSQANFVWYHLLGRGLVEPIDDFRLTNPPTHPELLEALSNYLVNQAFDLRSLVRTVMTSQTYQLSSQPNETNGDDETGFSRAIVRRLTAEKLLDAQCQVLDLPADLSGYPRGTRAGQMHGAIRGRGKGATSADRFLKTFGKSERLLACECERSNETSLKQVFTLIGDEGLSRLLEDPDSRLARLAQSGRSDAEIVVKLYWTALSRPPSAEELSAAQSQLSSAPDKFVVLQDLAWSLMNAKEFLFRK